LEKIYFSIRYIGSPWKSINGASTIYVVIPEYRYHFNEKNGFYAGVHIEVLCLIPKMELFKY
jgi:hypothetical protein